MAIKDGKYLIENLSLTFNSEDELKKSVDEFFTRDVYFIDYNGNKYGPVKVRDMRKGGLI